MAENITAKNLMKHSFLRLGEHHTLREALGVLLDPHARDQCARALIILSEDGAFGGILTARCLLRALLPDWLTETEADQENPDFEHHLLQSMQEKMNLPLREVMDPDIPITTPEERLPGLIELARQKRLDCLPVLDHGRVAGVIYIMDLFNAAAKLALETQDEEKKRP